MRTDRPFSQLLTTFIVLFVIVSGWLVYWQVGRAQDLTSPKVNTLRQCVADNVPQRGRILDRNGVVLAWSVRDPNAPCGWRRHYTSLKDPDHPDNTNIDTTLQPAILSLAPLIGYFDPTGYGITGLEAAYNDTLSGYAVDQSAPDFYTGLLKEINMSEHLKSYGTDVYLTIDIKVQKIAIQSFTQPGSAWCGPAALDPHATNGSVIVEDPKTGEILAMVSNPGFDNEKLVDHTFATDGATDDKGYPLTVGQEYYNNQLLTDKNHPLLNRPTGDYYIPGSSFKMLTLIAALDSGKYTLQTGFTQEEATAFTVNGHPFTANNLEDYKDGPEPPSFPLNVTHAFAYSDNVAFARIAVGTGQDNWLHYAALFGVSYGSKVVDIPFDVPVLHSWVYKPGVNFDPVTFAASGFGQGNLQITPLMESVMVSTVAADGKEYAPHVQLKTVAHDGTLTNNDPQLIGQIIKPQTARDVRQAMRAVVQYGSVGASGYPINKAATSPVKEGGKTGSAEGSTSYSDAWFTSLAPDDTSNPGGDPPRLTITVQRQLAGAGACQAPYALNIYEAIASQLPGYGLP